MLGRRGISIYKDRDLSTVRAFTVAKLPTGLLTDVYPEKGNIMYDIASEVSFQNGILYYGDGTNWLPIFSGSSVTLASAGGQTLINHGTGPNLIIAGLTAGNGISVSPIGAPPTSISIGNSGVLSIHTGVSADETGNITLSGTASQIGITDSPAGTFTFTNLSPASSITLTDAGVGVGHASLVPGSPQHGATLTVAGLDAGAGIVITGGGGTDVTIAQTEPTLTVLSTINSTLGASPVTIPATARYAYVLAAGGGGGGGGGGNDGGGGGGGAGGSIMGPVPISPGDSLTYTVGAGGAAGSPGTTGVDGTAGGVGSLTLIQASSMFSGATVSVTGGGGGGGGHSFPNQLPGGGGVGGAFPGALSISGASGGAGGTGVVAGAAGSPGGLTTTEQASAGVGSGSGTVGGGGGGAGASGMFSIGGSGGNGSATPGGGNAAPAKSAAGGGGGGAGTTGLDGTAGGGGGSGWVIVSYWS